MYDAFDEALYKKRRGIVTADGQDVAVAFVFVFSVIDIIYHHHFERIGLVVVVVLLIRIETTPASSCCCS